VRVYRPSHDTVACCYTNGNDSPHRRGVTPLLREIGCVRRTRRLDASIGQGCLIHVPIKMPPSLGDPSPHLMHGSLGLRVYASSHTAS